MAIFCSFKLQFIRLGGAFRSRLDKLKRLDQTPAIDFYPFFCSLKLQFRPVKTAKTQIPGLLGKCGDREVFLGFAPASLLANLSFADVFDEARGEGYQRRFNRQHSLEFKRYINQALATTIPLTFNLRPEFSSEWRLVRGRSPALEFRQSNKAVMAQVDCQHRLGYMKSSPIEFAFMTFIGLTVAEEMEIFRDINGKAKGLSSSLLDYTEAKLLGDRLSVNSPELYQAMQLSDNPNSPWHQRLDRGGVPTVGMKRIASLRTMQNAVKRFLRIVNLPAGASPQWLTETLINFWRAVSLVMPEVWSNPHRYMVTKGIGVYSLSSIAADLVTEATNEKEACTLDYFISKLSDFVDRVDWSNQGPMKGYGGVSGADAALELLRHTRKQGITKIKNGKQKYSVN